MKIEYKILRNIAIIFGVFTFGWIITDTVINYERKSPLYYLANKAFLKKEYSKSLILYEDLYRKEPENLYALEGKARSLARLKRYKEAENTFLRVIKRDKNFVAAHANLGILYDTEGKHYKALIYYNNAINLESDVTKGMSLMKRFLKNVQFKTSSIEERKIYLEKELSSKTKNKKLRDFKKDNIQPDYEL